MGSDVRMRMGSNVVFSTVSDLFRIVSLAVNFNRRPLPEVGFGIFS